MDTSTRNFIERLLATAKRIEIVSGGTPFSQNQAHTSETYFGKRPSIRSLRARLNRERCNGRWARVDIDGQHCAEI